MMAWTGSGAGRGGVSGTMGDQQQPDKRYHELFLPALQALAAACTTQPGEQPGQSLAQNFPALTHLHLPPAVFGNRQPSFNELVDYAKGKLLQFKDHVDARAAEVPPQPNMNLHFRALSLAFQMPVQHLGLTMQQPPTPVTPTMPRNARLAGTTTTPPIMADTPPPNPGDNILEPVPSHKRFSACYDWLLHRTTDRDLCTDARDVLPAVIEEEADSDVIEVSEEEMEKGDVIHSPVRHCKEAALSMREAAAQWVTAVGRLQPPSKKIEYDLGLRKFITGIAAASQMSFFNAQQIISEVVRQALSGEAYKPTMDLLRNINPQMMPAIQYFLHCQMLAEQEEARQRLALYQVVYGNVTPEMLQAMSMQNALISAFGNSVVGGGYALQGMNIPALGPHLPPGMPLALPPGQAMVSSSSSSSSSGLTAGLLQNGVIVTPRKCHRVTAASIAKHRQQEALQVQMSQAAVDDNDEIEYLGVFERTPQTNMSQARRAAKRQAKAEPADDYDQPAAKH